MESVTVLIVEDDGMINLELEEILTAAGFEVVSAFSGGQAIKKLDADSARFHALVTDIRIGDGPSGWEVAHRARELTPTIPVVYVSGDRANRWPAEGVPNSIMIKKPYVPAQILTAVTQLLNIAGTSLGGKTGE